MMSIIRTVVLLSFSIPLFAHAQPTPPPFDLEDRVREEVAQWTPWFWQSRDTGVVPPEAQGFQFSVLPYLHREWDPFGPAFAVFETIYASRLQLDLEVGPVYLLDDLLRDDPQVLARFRQYTLTGCVTTGPDIPMALVEHLDLVADAYANPELHPDFVGAFVDGEGNLVSEGLSPSALSSSGSGGVSALHIGDVPQEIWDLKDWLEDQLDDSDLDGVEYIRIRRSGLRASTAMTIPRRSGHGSRTTTWTRPTPESRRKHFGCIGDRATASCRTARTGRSDMPC